MDFLIAQLKKIEADISELKLVKKDVLSLKEACEYLDVSSSNLYKLTSKGQIPHYCPMGKKLYFKRTELDQWLLRNAKVNINNDEIARIAADYLIQNPKRKGGIV
jgi:excisionase family DNA binding protein